MFVRRLGVRQSVAPKKPGQQQYAAAGSQLGESGLAWKITRSWDCTRRIARRAGYSQNAAIVNLLLVVSMIS
jgi:hypothetical protein